MKRNKKTEDLTGQVFDKLTVIEFAGYEKSKKCSHAQWLCKCECGNEAVVRANSLKSKNTTSCGCLHHKIGPSNLNFKDLTKEILSNGIVALKYLHNKNGRSIWLFECSCGSAFECVGTDITNGHTTSCGCLQYRTGKNHPNYNIDITDEERNNRRKESVIKLWREVVYERDNYICQHCGDSKGGNLEAHHIENWADNPDLRYEIDNGITLCKKCHKKLHKQYGYRNTTELQIKEFLNKGN